MQRFRRKNGQKGFTMIELMVVVVIVGVLAGIAIPIYGKYIRNARLTEATGRIGEIITAAKAWAQENANTTSGNPMWPPTTNGGAAGASNGIVDLFPTDNFMYAITGGTDATTGTLTVVATGRNKMAGPPPVTVTITVVGITATGSAPIIANL